jgi:hypothetical protein
MLEPMEMMWRRVELARNDADTTLFLHLLYAGEMLSKLITAAFVSAIVDDRERHRYALIHGLLRSDGLGDWVHTLDESLIGPASQHLLHSANTDRRSLTEKFGQGAWQYEAVLLLSNVLRGITADNERPSVKLSLRQWFAGFANLRNKTRGHGATTPQVCAQICPDLEKSIRLIYKNLPLLQRPWAYLHRNLSGKYRVIPLGESSRSTAFDDLKTNSGAKASQYRSLEDGVYIHFDEPVKIELIETNVDVDDFFFPNGAFRGKTYELLSLITDDRK